MAKEADLRRKIIRWVREQGGDAHSVHGSTVQRAGEPDIDGWLPSPRGFIHLKIECKLDYNKPTPLQAYRVTQYKKAGYCAFTAYSLDDVKKEVERWAKENFS